MLVNFVLDRPRHTFFSYNEDSLTITVKDVVYTDGVGVQKDQIFSKHSDLISKHIITSEFDNNEQALLWYKLNY
jgi:hypothetical protein